MLYVWRKLQFHTRPPAMNFSAESSDHDGHGGDNAGKSGYTQEALEN